MSQGGTFIIPGEIINLSDKDSMRLGGYLLEIISSLESEYSQLFRDIAVWWKWYFGVPAVTHKTFPFAGASNIVIPYIQTMADSVTAVDFGKVFGAAPRIWTVKSQNEDETRRQLALNIDRHLQWAAAGGEFNLKLAMYDALEEKNVIGCSVLAVNYRRDVRNVFFGPMAKQASKVRSQSVEWTRGPVFEHAPREQYLWDTRYRIFDAPVVVREHEYTQAQLEIMASRDPAWNKEAIARIAGHEGNESSPAKAAREAKDGNEGRGGFGSGVHYSLKPHDIREVHLDVPVALGAGIDIPGMQDPEAPWIPLVIHIHRRSGEILRVVAEPYHIEHKPFYDFYYRKQSGRATSLGLAKKLEMIQEFMSTSFNQAVDSGTRANALWAVTTNRRVAERPIDPSHPFLVDQLDQLQFPNFHPQYLNNLPLINAANVFGERLTGVNDPLLGRETRHGGHPAPATSTLALLDQTDKMSIASDELMRETISMMGRDLAVLYQQYESNEDGRLQQIHGQADGDSLEGLLFPQEAIPANYIFDVTAMSPNQNPEAEMRRAVVVNQMTNDYWAFILRVIQQLEASMAQGGAIGPITQMAAVKAIESKTETYRRFLEAGNEDDINRFILELNKPGGPNDPGQFAAIGSQARELASGIGAVPAAGPAGGAVPSPEVGAVVTPAGGGILLQ